MFTQHNLHFVTPNPKGRSSRREGDNEGSDKDHILHKISGKIQKFKNSKIQKFKNSDESDQLVTPITDICSDDALEDN